MPPAKEPTEADIVLNKANVALARQQKLLASLLPPKTADDLKSAKTQEELDLEEEKLFAPTDDDAGIGAPVSDDPVDAILNKRKLTSDSKFLELLIGKKATKERALAQKSASILHTQKKELSKSTCQVAPEDSDEEEGRASMFASRKKRKTSKVDRAQLLEVGDITHEEVASDEGGRTPDKPAKGIMPKPSKTHASTSRKKVSTNFLDEMLASRAKKKK